MRAASRRHIGTYARGVDPHIAGSVLRLTASCRVVLCGSRASMASPERAIGPGFRCEGLGPHSAWLGPQSVHRCDAPAWAFWPCGIYRTEGEGHVTLES